MRLNTDSDSSIRFVDIPKPILSEAWHKDVDVIFKSTKPMPNRWWRFWWWALLGVRFRKPGEDA